MNTFDLIMLTIMLVLAVIGFARGAVKTILSVIGGIVSLVLSYVLGDRLSEPVYDCFFKESVNTEISSQITQMLENDSGNIGDSITSTLPEPLQFFISNSDMVDSLNSVVGDTTAQVVESATQIIQQVVEPVFIGIISICLTIVLFVIFNIAVTVLLHLSDFIDKIPVVGKANRIAGAVIGLVSGLVLTFATVAIFNQFVPVIAEDSDFSNNVQETSLFFEIFTDDESTDDVADEFLATELSTEGEYGY